MLPLALKRYLVCLSVVSVLMAVYSVSITPWLQPPKREAVATVVPIASTNIEGWWSDLFAPGDWQNDRPKVIQTEQGTLLFKTVTELDSGERFQLSPLTLIVPMAQKARDLAVGDLNAALNVYQNSQLAVVVAPQGAEIEFREAPDWTSGSIPPIVRGELLGSIQITGLKSKAEVLPNVSRVEWLIRTAHIRIEGRRIWTNKEVELISGNSQALGKDLSIGLKQDLMSSNKNAEGQFGLLDYLELRTIEKINVSLPAGGLWKGVELGRPEVAAAHATTPASLALRCKGSLQFDFDNSVANLSDHVDIQHSFDNDPQVDRFICHELIAQFAAIEEGEVQPADAIMVGPLILEGIDTLGIDSVGPRPAQNTVQITAPNIETELVAKRLKVELKKKFHRFTVDSRNGRSSEGARSGMAQVMLSYMGTVFRAPDLWYAKILDQQINMLKASGPGEVKTAVGSTVGQGSARWTNYLALRPPEIGKDSSTAAVTPGQTSLTNPPPASGNKYAAEVQLILLDGGAELESANQGHLRADHIMLTLKPDPGQAPVKPGSARMRIEQLDAQSAERVANDPRQLPGNVILGNATQDVQVKNLQFQFLYPNDVAATKSQADMELTDAAGRPMHQWVGPPSHRTSDTGSTPPPANVSGQVVASPVPGAANISVSPAPASTNPPTLGLPLTISAASSSPPSTAPGSLTSLPASTTSAARILIIGKELHSKIIMASPKPWIDQLSITGPVVVSPDSSVDPSAPAWRVAGNELTLNGGIDEHYELQIVGKDDAPARLAFGDGWIEGPIVRLSQRTGHVWIDQPGTLCVPGNLMGKPNAVGPSDGLPGGAQPLGPLGMQSAIQWIEPVKVHWDGGMLFNGLTANIRGNITFDGYARSGPDRLLFLKGKCDSVEVRLTENVNLGNPGKTSATIHSVTLRDNVDIRTAQTDLQRNRISLEEILLPEMTYQVATNVLVGRGPGDIHSQHQSSGSPIGQLASTSRPAQPKLQGLHLTFRDYMELKLTEKLLDFKGRVEVGMGAVGSLEEPIDIGQMRTLQRDQSLLRGDHLRIYDASDVTRSPTATMADGAWEMEANGNVNFETRTESGEMAGRAARVTYMQAKDLVVINGDPQIPAEIRFRPDDNSRYELAILSLWQGSINARSLQPSGELKIAGNSQFLPRGGALPENWKTGSINPNAVPGTPGAGGQASPTAPPSSPARPRDAINDWFKK